MQCFSRDLNKGESAFTRPLSYGGVHPPFSLPMLNTHTHNSAIIEVHPPLPPHSVCMDVHASNYPVSACSCVFANRMLQVEQLILRHAGQACMSSQNARRLARLCLSYSNRWLHSFEGTHKLALAEFAKALPPPGENKTKDEGRNGSRSRSADSVVHRGMLDRLVDELFS